MNNGDDKYVQMVEHAMELMNEEQRLLDEEGIDHLEAVERNTRDIGALTLSIVHGAMVYGLYDHRTATIAKVASQVLFAMGYRLGLEEGKGGEGE